MAMPSGASEVDPAEMFGTTSSAAPGAVPVVTSSAPATGLADDLFRTAHAQAAAGPRGPSRGTGPAAGGLERDAPVAAGWGRGPKVIDPRRIRYDMSRAKQLPSLSFGASKIDRMDATQGGDMLHAIHVMFGIENEPESRLLAFDRALWLQHTLNGASILQESRGTLKVDNMEYDIVEIVKKLGVDQRRFFRCFADEVTEANKEVLNSYDPYDPESMERHGQLMQVAVERGLTKYPHLAHDSSDACLNISIEERMAVMASKRIVLMATENKADAPAQRVPVGAAPLVGRSSE